MALNGNLSTLNDTYSVLSFNTGTFISMGKPFGSENYFIKEKCDKYSVRELALEEDIEDIEDNSRYSFCYNNSKKLLEKLFAKNIKLKIIGLQEYRFNFPNISKLSEALEKSFPGKDFESVNEKLTNNNNFYNNISTLMVNANQLNLFNNLSDNFKAIVGGIELVNNNNIQLFYEGITSIIDTNLTGNIKKYCLFNLSKDLPQDQKEDIRPALIVETAKFIIINIHAPWEKGLYNLNYLNNETFNESNPKHIRQAGNNLKNIINNKLQAEEINILEKTIILLGDFNDTNRKYPANFTKIGTENGGIPLNWCNSIKTCCYSEDGLERLENGSSLYKAYGDYIASSLPIISTKIPYLEYNFSQTLKFSDSFNNNVMKSLPMSDHAPIIVEINNDLFFASGNKKNKYKLDKKKTNKKNKYKLDKKKTNKKISITKRNK